MEELYWFAIPSVVKITEFLTCYFAFLSRGITQRIALSSKKTWLSVGLTFLKVNIASELLPTSFPSLYWFHFELRFAVLYVNCDSLLVFKSSNNWVCSRHAGLNNKKQYLPNQLLEELVLDKHLLVFMYFLHLKRKWNTKIYLLSMIENRIIPFWTNMELKR